MNRVVALLAAAGLALAAAGCGGGGAEPGAPQGATLMLDFQPNAVHAGLFTAERRGYFDDAGLDLEIREPSSTADSAKLLEAGRAEFAILDINDLGLARERGLDLVAIAAIVQRPLASVIAADRREVERPLDLEGGTVGVTGVPSDDAVLDTVLRSDAVAPDEVERVTIGFNAVASLAAGKVDAATGFWNAEGVELQRLGIPTREFRVNELGAPRYPELVVVTTRAGLLQDRDRACALARGLGRGYTVLGADPPAALEELLAANEGLERHSQALQLEALAAGEAFVPSAARGGAGSDLRSAGVLGWVGWAQDQGLIEPGAASADEMLDGFAFDLLERCPASRAA
jgi:NitT/TauT family transport system substrate-binding protein/putative hydroxymethylpyrimidine transport system substrate-binding protein